MTRPAPMGRVFALDNLRAALVVLVVLHQASLVYSSFSAFYYQEPLSADPLAFLLLGLFALINQAWFMSALFFIAGYFAPETYDRRGPGGFLAGRFLRLGLPLVVGMLVIEPIARLGRFLMPAQPGGLTQPPGIADYPNMIGLGPFWFVALLLVFSIVYALWRMALGPRAGHRRLPVPNAWHARGFVLALAIVVWVWRMLVPLGQTVPVLSTALIFPTLSYLPHYFALFVLGILTRRSGWLPAATPEAAWQGFFTSLLVTILILPWALSGVFFQLNFSPGMEFAGHGTWQSALFALWDCTLTIGMLVAALGLFEARVNREGPFWRFLSRQSYAVYLTHVVVVVFVAWALSGLAAPALLKFVLLAVIALPIAFLLAYAIRKIPGVHRVV